MKALLFGSIGTVVDSSELQLEAYNRAFKENGLDWRWDVVAYRAMLTRAGGKARMRWYAEQIGDEIPADSVIDSVHQRKSDLTAELLNQGRARVRPGVVRLLGEARDADVRLGWVTSTELGNLEATLGVSDGHIRLEHFDVVTHRGTVSAGKPATTPWEYALSQLGLQNTDAIAIEDTEVCVRSAVDAGLATVATPNAFGREQDFSAANAIVNCLGDDDSAARVLSGQNIVEGGKVTIERLKRMLPDLAIAS